MKLVRITQEQLEMLDGVEKLLETDLSISEIMTGNADDAPGLGKMYRRELEEKIRKVTPENADAYMVGEGRMGEIKPVGFSAVRADITYPITFFNLPSLI